MKPHITAVAAAFTSLTWAEFFGVGTANDQRIGPV
jgi:hypothetical protein